MQQSNDWLYLKQTEFCICLHGLYNRNIVSLQCLKYPRLHDMQNPKVQLEGQPMRTHSMFAMALVVLTFTATAYHGRSHV